MNTLSELMNGIDIIASTGNLDVPITGITDDSREVSDGSAFVCMPAVYESPNARWIYDIDGNDYIPDAVKRGATAIVSQKPIKSGQNDVIFIQVQDARYALAKISAEFFGNPSRKLKVVGITGTNGKTSTCYLSRSVLEAGDIKTAISGTIIQRSAGDDVPAGMTTPEAHRLQKMLKDVSEEGFESVVMEVSSHALELKRADGIEFDVAVFTNLTQDHLDFHRGMRGYLASKMRLFRYLMKGSSFAVINLDDPAGGMVARSTESEVITYAVQNEADLKVCDFQSTVEGLTFRVSVRGNEEIDVKLQLLGEYNLHNALAAFGVGISQGLDLETIKAGLESLDFVPGRFERVDCGQDYTVVVDYAHTPDALERVLEAGKRLTKKRLITVFGCGGDRDKGKRPLMGNVAAKLSDHVIVTSDNPRTEDPMEIISQIQEGISGHKYDSIPDRRSAIQKAIEMAKKGDMIIIAGKGHENYQILNDGRIHFDDREIACEFIGQ